GTLNVASPNFVQAGTTMLSLNDNNGHTWSILELLQTFSSSKIISHPHVVATTNKEASITIGEQRYLRDAASGSLGGTTVITFKPINADLKVKITPRISTMDTINLQVLININEFLAGSNTQAIRTLETNANIKSGGIFALGGLIKNNSINMLSETPFLSKIPILGWFFKKKTNEVIQNNLTVFICPTVIQPRLRGGVGKHTNDYINLAKDYASEELFTNLKDPITHWFFPPADDTDEQIDEFVERCQANEHTTVAIQKTSTTVRQEIKQENPVVAENNNSTELPNLNTIIKDDDPNPFLKSKT
ncbi:MAG TPA: type II and III secretion system protein, partial [Flavisolibacter sp.]|nr:type II and III secretion system protein [Flavisolibacter sp.]